MSVYYMPLKYGSAGAKVYLRELTGHDELAVTETGTLGALQLVDRLLVDLPDAAFGPHMAREITTADRDALLAEIYRRTYGNRIESTIPCQGCALPLDLSFPLDGLLAFIHAEMAAVPVKQTDTGVFELEDGSRFRLPRGTEECAVLGLPPAQAQQVLKAHCLLQVNPNCNEEQLQAVMGQLAPVLETEMVAHCPECGHQQAILFDIQSYLLGALVQERKAIILEVHRLAMAYHWSQAEILGLPRSLRRQYLSFVLAELGLN